MLEAAIQEFIEKVLCYINTTGTVIKAPNFETFDK